MDSKRFTANGIQHHLAAPVQGIAFVLLIASLSSSALTSKRSVHEWGVEATARRGDIGQA